jgi:hypothetical protein
VVNTGLTLGFTVLKNPFSSSGLLMAKQLETLVVRVDKRPTSSLSSSHIDTGNLLARGDFFFLLPSRSFGHDRDPVNLPPSGRAKGPCLGAPVRRRPVSIVRWSRNDPRMHVCTGHSKGTSPGSH